jgi:hypothetical protein
LNSLKRKLVLGEESRRVEGGKEECHLSECNEKEVPSGCQKKFWTIQIGMNMYESRSSNFFLPIYIEYINKINLIRAQQDVLCFMIEYDMIKFLSNSRYHFVT